MVDSIKMETEGWLEKAFNASISETRKIVSDLPLQGEGWLKGIFENFELLGWWALIFKDAILLVFVILLVLSASIVLKRILLNFLQKMDSSPITAATITCETWWDGAESTV